MTQGSRELRDLISTAAPLSTEVSWLLELAKDPTAGVDRLLPTIGRDPRLSGFLMRLAASGYYGRPRPAITLREALVRLGNQKVAMIAFAGRAGRTLRRRLWRYGYARGDLWRHSLGVAFGAAFLLRNRSDMSRSELAATGGLFHDIGKALVHQAIAGSSSVIEPAPEEQDILACERRLTGFDHAEAGASLLEHWGLPAPVITAVRHHHEAAQAPEGQDVVESVAKADWICNLVSLGPSGASGRRDGALGDKNSCPESSDVAALLERIHPEVAKLEQITRGVT